MTSDQPEQEKAEQPENDFRHRGTFVLRLRNGVSVYAAGSVIVPPLFLLMPLVFAAKAPHPLLALLVMPVPFLSVFLHEVARMEAARRQGMTVRAVLITATGSFMLLDLAGRRHLPWKIGLAGLLANLLAGSLLLLLRLLLNVAWPLPAPAGLLQPFAQPVGLAALSYASLFNLAYGVINLFPAFPTDAGLALHNWITSRLGSRWASRIVGTLGLVGAIISISVLITSAISAFPLLLPPRFRLNWMLFRDSFRTPGSASVATAE
ncbi:hypothetical protein GCM10011390_27480 [Aureimonas endophytica]|uniref:Uncharacterized protein n=1 Tax=Aureimonas endophytica TaxID=2027858 RepID=A0A916ZNV9_9HYPH|nr:hypothetical protein [Aureimonas endophytica]GGE06899.1 hypothetical protein GCM10011390_27480 [Aureimonas endophytica]